MAKLEFGVSKEEVEAQVDEHVEPTEKPVPTRRLWVIDPGKLGSKGVESEGAMIGYIDEPTSFCEGIHCKHNEASKDPLRFHQLPGSNMWVHTCGLPTRAWWQGTFHDLVRPLDSNPPQEHDDSDSSTDRDT